MPVQTKCTVAEAVRLNDFACSLTLDVGEEMAGQIACGQFVHIKCGHSRLLRRPISICDWQENLLRVVFEVRGEGTEWLARRKAGDRLDVLGPLGHGFDVAAGSLLVVGGGIGAPPMLGCAKYAASRGSEVHAVLGFRDAEHKMLTEDFAECCRSLNVISDDGSTGRRPPPPPGAWTWARRQALPGSQAPGHRHRRLYSLRTPGSPGTPPPVR